MKKVVIFNCLFFLSLLFVKAQPNLVLNPSFEVAKNLKFIPRGIIEVDSLLDVYSPTDASPDLLSTTGTMYWLPQAGGVGHWQYPRTGKNMVGLFTISDGYYPNWPNRDNLLIGLEEYNATLNVNAQYREYVAMKLASPLKKDYKYNCSFYVNNPGHSPYTSLYCHNIGAFFSETEVYEGCACPNSFENAPIRYVFRLDYIPQIENTRAQQELTDTLGWQKVEGSFIAQGGEQYVILGNFRNYYNSEIDDTPWRNNPFATNHPEDESSYYFIDDISVVEVGSTVGIVEQAQSKNVFYNNSTNILNVSERGNLVIYNMQGVKVKELLVKSGEVVSVNAEDLGGASGVYVWQLQTEKDVQRGKFAPSNSP
jgi:hypothetical protein